MTSEVSASVSVRSERGVGRLTLDRPAVVNALDVGMIRLLSEALDAWAEDPDVERVVLDGAGDRGFCAGGDVRALRAAIVAGRAAEAGEFFRAEYALDAAIAEYPKPVVTLADGVTMGGGIGLAAHAAVRIVTERSLLAMPETRIGLTPDVGASRLLARAPGRLGEYLALTGAVVGAADAIMVGLADHLVPTDRLDAVRHALGDRADPAGAAELVLLFDETPGPAPLAEARAWIDDAFSAPDVAGIRDRLRACGEPAAADAADALDALSPTSLAVTLEAVRRARELPDLRSALAQEYGLVMWFVHTRPDFPEGIRALLVDKDRSPRWSPPRIDDVAAHTVAEAFAFRPEVPLWG